MKRLHVHVAVEDLPRSINFYSALFAAQPAVVKTDYAKWMLDDPRANFAISTRGRQPGLDHLGIQVENADELDKVKPLVATRSRRSPGLTIRPVSPGKPFSPRARAPPMVMAPATVRRAWPMK